MTPEQKAKVNEAIELAKEKYWVCEHFNVPNWREEVDELLELVGFHTCDSVAVEHPFRTNLGECAAVINVGRRVRPGGILHEVCVVGIFRSDAGEWAWSQIDGPADLENLKAVRR